MRIFLAIVVGFLAVTGIGASVMHYLREPYNEGFLDHPLITGAHVVLGGIYLAIAPFQFISSIRNRFLDYHRWAGRFLAAVGLIVGASAFFLAVVVPFSGWFESLINGAFAVWFFFALIQGVLYIRVGNVDKHREWMLRAFAVGLAIATMRLIFVPALIYTNAVENGGAARLSIISFTIALVTHALFAEFWIWKTNIGRTVATATAD